MINMITTSIGDDFPNDETIVSATNCRPVDCELQLDKEPTNNNTVFISIDLIALFPEITPIITIIMLQSMLKHKV